MAKKISKKMKAANALVDRNKFYTIEEAVKILKGNSGNRKFNETIEVSMNLDIDPRQADQQIRGMTDLPHGTGAGLRVADFAKDAKAEEARKAGADIVGAEDLAEKVQKGEIDFDRCIATPDMMVLLGRLGKVLGPKGLMPNPKLGTVTMDVAKAVASAKGGSIEYRAEKAGIIHAGVGKASFTEQALSENVAYFIDVIRRARPAGAKGSYIKRITVSSTMGPGIKIDLASATKAA